MINTHNKKPISFLLLIAFLTATLAYPGIAAPSFAMDDNSYITGVTLADENGNIINEGDTVPLHKKINVRYTVNVPVSAADGVDITLPDQLATVEDGEIIVTAKGTSSDTRIPESGSSTDGIQAEAKVSQSGKKITISFPQITNLLPPLPEEEIVSTNEAIDTPVPSDGSIQTPGNSPDIQPPDEDNTQPSSPGEPGGSQIPGGEQTGGSQPPSEESNSQPGDSNNNTNEPSEGHDPVQPGKQPDDSQTSTENNGDSPVENKHDSAPADTISSFNNVSPLLIGSNGELAETRDLHQPSREDADNITDRFQTPSLTGIKVELEVPCQWTNVQGSNGNMPKETTLVFGGSVPAITLKTFSYLDKVELQYHGSPLGSTQLPSGTSQLELYYTFSYAVSDIDLFKDGFTINLPSQLTLSGEDFDQPLNSGSKQYGAVHVNKSSIQFTFDQSAIPASGNISGYFGYAADFKPAENTGKETLAFTVAGAANPVFSVDVSYKPQNKPPILTKTRENCTFADGSTGYKWTTTLTPGNQGKGKVTLEEILTDMELVTGTALSDGTSASVTFDGQVLTSPGGFQYTTSEAGSGVSTVKTSTLTYELPKTLENLIAGQAYQFVYYTKVGQHVYMRPNDSKASSVANLSGVQGLPAGQTVSSNNDEASKKDSVIDVAPKLINKVSVYNSVKKQVEWTVTLNGDNLNMTRANFFINYKGTAGAPSYLTTITGIQIKKDGGTASNLDDSGWKTLHPAQDAGGTGYDYGISYDASGSAFRSNWEISFVTPVSDEFYMQNITGHEFNVDVFLEWWYPLNGGGEGAGGIVPGKWKDEMNKPMGDSVVVKKTFASYEASTGSITWDISVNNNGTALTSVMMVDKIDEATQVFDPAQTASTGGLSAGQTAVYNPSDQTVIFSLNNVNAQQNFTLKTKAKFAKAYNNAKTIYTNDIAISGGGIEGTVTAGKAQGEHENNLLRKTGAYDRSNRTITWNMTINADQMQLMDLKLTDTIPAGVTYVPDSLKITAGGVALPTAGAVYTPPVSSSQTSKLEYSFGQGSAIADTYLVEFKTEVTDLEPFYTNNAAFVTNSAVLAFKGLDESGGWKPSEATAEHSVKVDASVVTKTSDYKANRAYINWTVTVNHDHMQITNGAIIDKFMVASGTAVTPGALFLIDAANMKLMRYDSADSTTGTEVNIKPSGSVSDASAQAALVYDRDNAAFKLDLPSSTTAKYVLTYTLKVMDQSQRDFTMKNDAKFTCEGKNEQTASGEVRVILPFAGIITDPAAGRIPVEVKDNLGIKISGAKIKLSNAYNDITEVVTDKSGTVIFDGLAENGTYTVVLTDIPSPNGESDHFTTASATSVSAVATSAGALQTFELNRHNPSIIGITFLDKDNDSKPITNAAFTLTEAPTGTTYSAVTDNAGQVTFSGLYCDVDYKVAEDFSSSHTDYAAQNYQAIKTTNGAVLKTYQVERKKVNKIVYLKDTYTGLNLTPNAINANFTLSEMTGGAFTPVASPTVTPAGKNGIKFSDLKQGIEYQITSSYGGITNYYDLTPWTSVPTPSSTAITFGAAQTNTDHTFTINRIKDQTVKVRLMEPGQTPYLLPDVPFTLTFTTSGGTSAPISSTQGPDPDHQWVTFENLARGMTYMAKEDFTGTTYGSIFTTTPYAVSTGLTSAPTEKTFDVQRIKTGKLIITLAEKDNTGVTLSGAAFVLTAPSGTTTKAITGNDGKATFANLGVELSYGLTGHFKNRDFKELTITENIVASSGSIVLPYEAERLKTGALEITLQDKDKSDVKIQDAAFMLTNPDHTTQEAITGSDGQVTFTDLSSGLDYTISGRYQDPDGHYSDWATNGAIYTAKAGETGKKVFEVERKKIGTITVNVTDKVDSAKKLSGASITLYNLKNETEVTGKLTDGSGFTTFTGISSGIDYKITIDQDAFTSAGIRYKALDVEATATGIEGNIDVPFHAGKVNLDARLYVTKSRMGGTAVPGATFGLFMGNRLVAQQVTGSDGKAVFTDLITDQVYTIKEIAPAEGYLLDTTETIFDAIPSHGTIANDTHNAGAQQPSTPGGGGGSHGGGGGGAAKPPENATSPAMENPESSKENTTGGGILPENNGTLKVTKLDSDGNLMKGAVYGLFNSKGEKVDEQISDENGAVIFTGLTPGETYSVKELRPPAGMAPDTLERSFIAESQKEVQMVLGASEMPASSKTSIFKLPHTGQPISFNLLILIGLTLIILGAALRVINKRRKSS